MGHYSVILQKKNYYFFVNFFIFKYFTVQLKDIYPLDILFYILSWVI